MSKEEIITFKVGEDLSQALEAVENRSEFIRQAVLAALEKVCPMCHGTGVFSLAQWKHWQAFSANHKVTVCPDCRTSYLVCHCEDSGSMCCQSKDADRASI